MGPCTHPCGRNYAKLEMSSAADQRWGECECPVRSRGGQQDRIAPSVRIWARPKCGRTVGGWCLPHRTRFERLHRFRLGREIGSLIDCGDAQESSRLVVALLLYSCTDSLIASGRATRMKRRGKNKVRKSLKLGFIIVLVSVAPSGDDGCFRRVVPQVHLLDYGNDEWEQSKNITRCGRSSWELKRIPSKSLFYSNFLRC